MDEWDTTIGSKAYYMNVVLRESLTPLSTAEIMEEVRKRGYPEFGATASHLRRLEGKDPKRPTAFIRRVGNRFETINRSQPAAVRADHVKRQESEQPTPVSVVDDVIAVFDDNAAVLTAKRSLIEARLGQGRFRDAVLTAWNNKCAVTGSTTAAAIRASHIKPWRESSDHERLDASNGIPLIASLDALFDRGLISFADSGTILISEQLSLSERSLFGLQNARLSRPLSDKTKTFLAFHRERHGFAD
jgi:hypothetical protein